MRTKHINGKDAVLMCGGAGFKVYGADNEYIVSLGRRHIHVPKSSAYYRPIGQYTMLKYLSGAEKERVQKNFNDLLHLLKGGVA